MNTQNNQSFMVHADIITLQADKTLEKIAYKLLINLFSKGNNNAYDIAINRNNGLVTIEDLAQTMFLFLMEHSNDWYLYRTSHRYSTDEYTTKLVFFNDDTPALGDVAIEIIHGKVHGKRCVRVAFQ